MQQIPKILLLSLAAIWMGSPAEAQNAAPESSSVSTPAATPASSPTVTPLASPTPLPLADVTAQIVAAEEERGKIEAMLASEQAASANGDAVALARDIDLKLAETAKTLAAGPSLEALRDLEARWQTLSETLETSKRSLSERSKRCEEHIKSLQEIENTWTQNAKLAKADNGAPRELRERMAALSAAAQKNRAAVQKRRGELAPLLTQAWTQDWQVNEMIAALKKARTQAVGRLFVTESVPIWSIPLWSESVRLSAGFSLAQETRTAWGKQWTALATYVGTQAPTFLIHACLFVALLCGLYWARRRVRAWVDDEPSLRRAAQVFEAPISVALAFSLVAATWIYPQAPRLLVAIGGAASLIPAVLILRRLLDRHLFPVLNVLVAFYFTDQLRTVAAALPIAGRLLFLAEMAGGVLFLAWLLRAGQLDALRQEDPRLFKVTLAGSRLALAIFSGAFLANLLGCVSLGNLLGDAALRSAYLAVVLYAATRIADGLIIGGFLTRPLSTLGMLRNYRTLIWQRTHRIIRLAALLLWAEETLDLLSLRSTLFEKAAGLFIKGENLTILGQLCAFGLVVWAAFLLSRFIRFALEEDFYPKWTAASPMPSRQCSITACCFSGFISQPRQRGST